MELLVFSFITILGFTLYQMLKPTKNYSMEYRLYGKEKLLRFQENGVKSNA